MFWVILQIFLKVYCLSQIQASFADKSDAYLTVPQILSKYGYPTEVHSVTTFDGYILTLHRIPHGKNSQTVSDKSVLVLHGVFLSSAAYLLADEGYDVWLGNVRGVEYSRNHTTLNPDRDEKFWNFTLDEIGTIDLPAMIDYVLNTTYQSSLYYVGYSQGTTIFYILIATHPEYNTKIKVNINMAPAVYLSHMQSIPVQSLANWHVILNILFRTFQMNEVPSQTALFIKAVICKLSPSFCNYAFMTIFSYKPSDVNSTILTPFLGHFPIPVSRKQANHFLHIIKSGYFRSYDYGRKNTKVYGTSVPPSYNLSFVTAKCHLFYGRDDQLVSETDVIKLCEELGDACVEKHLVTDADGVVKHLDFVMGKRIRELVYLKLVSIMGAY